MNKQYTFKQIGTTVAVADDGDDFVGTINYDVQNGVRELQSAIKKSLGIKESKEVTAWIAGWNTAHQAAISRK